MTGHNTTMNHIPLAQALAEAVRTTGVPEHIARSFAKVPRHRFLPDVVWSESGERIDRAEDPQAWMHAAYTDQTLITQLDDGRPGGPGMATSSSSAPSAMARMMHAARIEPRSPVLEVGTGTGYGAALLSELVGDKQVTSVEIDQQLADTARGSLYAAGYVPSVILGNGERIELPRVRRVLSTCAVASVPWAWFDQVHPRGLVVTPWSPSPGSPHGVLAVLERYGSGLAEGRFVGPLRCMWSRAQRWPSQPAPGPEARAEHTEVVSGDPRGPWLTDDTSLLLSLLLPHWSHGTGATPGATEPHVWLSSSRCESWARLHADGRIEQGGRRLLVHEAREALRRWRSLGEPGVDQFGLTLDRTPGKQSVWVDSPQNVLWDTQRQLT
ncbi:rRNA adenine N-6-methyltransferase family protein [Nocardiopsis synnemataformans]|uniref:rRNA adenine N-6-methyltransferase family protein n=1 Tax=Nocardiopsis synnemataformans TaxID=61305 RepID=UPI003EBE6ED3